MSVLGANNETRRGTLRVHLVGDNAELRGAAKSALLALGDPPLEIEESTLGAPPAAGAPDVLMVMLAGNEEQGLLRLQSQAAQNSRPVIFALSQTRSPGLMKRALRAGADELLFMPLDPGDATRALLKISEARWRSDRHDGGVVCSFASVVGGVGVTTLVANLGLALRQTGKRVALIDLDLQTGGLAVVLGLEPEVTILPLIRLDRKLDSLQLESALTKHPSGLYLLAAPKRIEEGELVSDVTVGTVIDLMRQLFDFVIIDCGDHIDENAVAAWERSEHLFYVLEQSITSARCAWRFVDLFERLGLSSLQPRFVLNRHRPMHPITDKQIETTLGRELYTRIPADDRALERAEVTAKDLWQVAPASPLARALEDLARRIAPSAAASAAEPDTGFIARLKSAFANHA
ncbi:MAG TPA: AAA family ATPase [Candidatus Binataceae bacterium]|nr:AAA family ATPase [Candidatus Binataceae bacterium]